MNGVSSSSYKCNFNLQGIKAHAQKSLKHKAQHFFFSGTNYMIHKPHKTCTLECVTTVYDDEGSQ